VWIIANKTVVQKNGVETLLGNRNALEKKKTFFIICIIIIIIIIINIIFIISQLVTQHNVNQSQQMIRN